MTSEPHIPLDPADPDRIRTTFGSIARRYDLANHLLSLGIDRSWRRRAVKLTAPSPADTLLDMCCGTGDFAFAFARAGVASITGCDFSEEMIQLAQTKQQRFTRTNKTSNTHFQWKVADCSAADFADCSFDIISCAFGIRNMADLRKSLAEMHRLLKPSGRLCILEFTLPRNPIVRAVYLLYFKYILPLAGGLISGRFSAYRHLASSVCKWHANVDLPAQLQNAGFTDIRTTPLSLGIAAACTATRSASAHDSRLSSFPHPSHLSPTKQINNPH
jgi:demethylmenaquinone methyltransferase/2-methoxy-6-polyprenyl-1,4-benzoquinol methylase